MLSGIRYDYYAAPPALSDAPFIYDQDFHNPAQATGQPRPSVWPTPLNSKTVLERQFRKVLPMCRPRTCGIRPSPTVGLSTAFHGISLFADFRRRTGVPERIQLAHRRSLATPTIYALDQKNTNTRTPLT